MNNIIPFPYEGHAVRFNLDGWINATDVAKRYGKKPVEWLRLPESPRVESAATKAEQAATKAVEAVNKAEAQNASKP